MAETPCTGWTPVMTLCSTWAAASAEQQAYALRNASYVLWAATGRRFGLCPVTVRPCSPSQEPLYLTYPVRSTWGIWGDGFGNLADAVAPVGCCSGSCGCTPAQVGLPGPVGAVTAVTLDGVPLDPAAYRLVGRYLVRQDGDQWPLTQDLSLAAGAEGTWSVSYTRGEAVPDVLNDAAGIYACELARSLVGSACRLPQRVQSISRQGVEIEYLSTENYLDEGLTGVYEVDLTIRSLNPGKLKARPRVLSPDLPVFY